MPASDRVVALDALEVEDEHEHQREARQPVDERGAVAAANSRLRKIVEVEHRRAAAVLDQHEGGQQHRGGDQPADHDAGRPSPTGRPCETASTRPVSPTTKVAVPAQVEPAPRVGRGQLAQDQRAPGRAGEAERHVEPEHPLPRIATSAPPSTGPRTRPIAATIVLVPIARPSCSRGKASVTSAAALANRNARADPLQDPPQDQLRAVGREARAERGGGERDEAPDVGAACGRTGRDSRPAVSTSTVEAIM